MTETPSTLRGGRLHMRDNPSVDEDIASVISSRPAIIRRSVDFPQPEGPTKTTNSPFSAEKLTPWTAGMFTIALDHIVETKKRHSANSDSDRHKGCKRAARGFNLVHCGWRKASDRCGMQRHAPRPTADRLRSVSCRCHGFETGEQIWMKPCGDSSYHGGSKEHRFPGIANDKFRAGRIAIELDKQWIVQLTARKATGRSRRPWLFKCSMICRVCKASARAVAK